MRTWLVRCGVIVFLLNNAAALAECVEALERIGDSTDICYECHGPERARTALRALAGEERSEPDLMGTTCPGCGRRILYGVSCTACARKATPTHDDAEERSGT